MSDMPDKDDRLEMRLSSVERLTFTAAATLRGMSLTSWMRYELRLIAQKQLKRAGQPVAFEHAARP